MRTYRLAVIPGDGIGQEVIPEGLKVLCIRERAPDPATGGHRFSPGGPDP